MAATDGLSGFKSFDRRILAAALLLPGVQPAQADLAPERAQVSFKYLNYQDSQPGQERVSVNAQSLGASLPIAGEWLLEGTVTRDAISGASPFHHSAMLRNMDDKRIAKDVRVTRYFPRGSVSLGTAYSREHDYVSRAYSVNGSFSSEDKNTTWMLGAGLTDDAINAASVGVTNKSKNTLDVLVGVSQVLSPTDIVQLNLTRFNGHGYFSDPYKFADKRPGHKGQTALLLRWNHHFEDWGGTARSQYRYYSDSFGIKAHTVGTEYVQPLDDGWTLTPSIRLYTQTAARFYLDPDPAAPAFPTIPPGAFIPGVTIQSQDQRLSAYGAMTLGLKVSKTLGDDWLLDLKYERYQQRNDWQWGGSGSPGIATLHARFWQLGLSRHF